MGIYARHNSEWYRVDECDADANGGGTPPGAAVISGATGAVTTSSFTGDGTNGDLGQAYDVYKFTGAGNLNVSESGLAEVLVIGGGGGGGACHGGGGGAGGFLSQTLTLNANLPTVIIGAGGSGAGSGYGAGSNGGYSVMDNVASLGGGGGGSRLQDGPLVASRAGASGGGGGGANTAAAGAANAGGQGTKGGKGGSNGTAGGGGGGGGAGGAGTNGTSGSGNNVGKGGDAKTSSINETDVQYAAGGGGGAWNGSGAAGGASGGAGGGHGARGSNGTANKGSGGGGGGAGVPGAGGGNGGSGIVIVRVKVPTTSFAARSEVAEPKTAHAARIENGVVRQVIVIPHMDDDDAKITEYCNSIGLEGTWVDTSYTGSRRGKYAGVGDLFDPRLRNAEFVSPGVEVEE